ncbi:MAG: protein adenylyltransferase SelO family protein [Nitrospira sp.]
MWRELGTFSSDPAAKNERLREHFLNPERFDAWAGEYRERLRSEESRDDERRAGMERVNPKYVLRNYLAQGAIEKAQQKDYSEIDRLLNLLRDPYTDQPGMDAYAAAPPNWGKHLSVSCSS